MTWSKKVMNGADDIMSIAKHKIPVKRCELSPSELNFWDKNPRIYSIVHGSDEPLTQVEIKEILLERPHVRELIKDIVFHDGLLHDVIVLDGTFEVIEGNSRLAAYQHLSIKKPLEYPKMKCTVLPDNTSEIIIYAYLNQEHIKGKAEWIPYEQAGIFYRLVKQGQSIDTIRSEMNVGPQVAKRLIDTYEFMVENGQDKPNKWSFYYEYLKNRKVKKMRDSDLRLDEVILEQVGKNKFTAQELRDRLPVICENEKAYEKFVSGKMDLNTSYETLVKDGKTEDAVVKFKNIEDYIDSLDKEQLQKLNQSAAKNVKFRIGKILTKLRKLLDQSF